MARVAPGFASNGISANRVASLSPSIDLRHSLDRSILQTAECSIFFLPTLLDSEALAAAVPLAISLGLPHVESLSCLLKGA